MLDVRVRIGDLKVGDVFSATFTNGKRETMVELPKEDEGLFTWKTDKQPWTSSSIEQEVTLHATSSGAVGERVAEALDAFPEDVRVVALRAFCLKCGKRRRACREHL